MAQKQFTVFLKSLQFENYLEKSHQRLTRPEGLLDPKIRDEMSDFLEIFPTENQI